MNTEASDELLFLAEEDPADESEGIAPSGWKLLIVDDEQSIHEVTSLALGDFSFSGRPLNFLHAHSGAEAREVLRAHDDIAIILLDVVMETDHAGLDVVRFVREELGNHFIRIVLRTGQPGQAPERRVITQYDINDYKEKTELTSSKLFTVVYTGLSSYRDLMALEANRTGLEKVIDSSASIFEISSIQRFSQGVLEQLTALLFLNEQAMLATSRGLAATCEGDDLIILAGTRDFAETSGKLVNEVLDQTSLPAIEEALKERCSVFREDSFVGYFETHTGVKNIIYVTADVALSVPDRNLIELFCKNVAIALENLHLKKEIEDTQRELVIMLSEAIEARSREAGQHVRRVAEFSRLLALLYGLSEDDAEMLHVSSPLHDVGKIAIPDAILNKPGPLTDAERVEMMQHAEIGQSIFSLQELPVLRAAAIIAGEHHERWDGKGYPNKKSGDDIHIFGRIVSLADVFDALGSQRCYKDAWGDEDIKDLLRKERGQQFEPKLIDIIMDHWQEFIDIRERLQDNAPAPLPATSAFH